MIVEIIKPESPVVEADCVFPCTVKNTDTVTREFRVFLFQHPNIELDREPDFHWQNVAPGAEFGFNGFWNTLNFKPTELKKYSLRIELHEQHLGKLDEETFEITTLPKPDWWESLLSSVGIGNVEQITDPILDLFTGFDIEGWTKPPYKCFICGQEFNGDTADDDFANHLISHLNAFEDGWF